MRQPPKLARKFFILLSGEAHVDDLLGDLDEWFHEHAKSKSLFAARCIYWRQVLSLSFSYALRKRKRDARHGLYAASSFGTGMFYNYLKVAVRNLYQYKYFSVINAFGLALGMSVSLLLISIYSYVSTYDDFHENGDRIYTVTSTVDTKAEEAAYATAPVALANKLEQELSAVEEVVRVVKGKQQVVTRTENIPVTAYYSRSNFFSLFSFSFVRGGPSALDKSDQVILTETTAHKLFAEEDPIGKTIEMEGGALLQVAGVIKDYRRTHLSFDVLVSYATLPLEQSAFESDWVKFLNQYVYVRLREGEQVSSLQKYLERVTTSVYRSSSTKVTFDAMALQDIAMGPDLRNAIGEKWEASGFFLFGVFALMILLPACFNYANLSIARAMRRAKEIALRKTVGGVRSQIFFQFVTETVVIALISLIGSLGIFVLIRSEFQSMLVAGSSLDLSLTPRLLILFMFFAIGVGVSAGVLPAAYFAKMNPLEAFKSRGVRGGSLRVRKVLTVFQFVLSFGFILSLLAIHRQYRYATRFDFGFQQESIVDIPFQDVKPQQLTTALSSLSCVKSISQSSGILGVTFSSTWLKTEANDSIATAQQFVDRNYMDNLQIVFLAGDNFPNEDWSRERYAIVNEEFLKVQKIAAPIDAIGRMYQVDGRDLEVIGVVKNFHFAPLNYPIGSFVFRENPAEFRYANVLVNEGNVFNMLTQMEDTWKALPTEKKFIAKFFEDEVLEAYGTYSAVLKIVGFLALMAITISMLGMIGMVVYTAQTRTKEVGIRKVMGATVESMMLLLSRDYLKMLGWSVLISTPLTILLLNAIIPHIQYYHAEISVWDVLMSLVVLAGVGVSTIMVETYKTAMTNPATTLRSE